MQATTHLQKAITRSIETFQLSRILEEKFKRKLACSNYLISTPREMSPIFE